MQRLTQPARCLRAAACLAALVTVGLSACSSGGGGDALQSGVFKDSNVAGLAYDAAGQRGVTGADGVFTYVDGRQVSFAIGGVVLGAAPGQPVITPLNLVPEASTGTLEVQNIARFVLMLDFDGDPGNGITISQDVQDIAETWEQVDFSTPDLDAELVDIIADAASVDGTPHDLPDAATAQAHLEETLLCARSGAFRGLFTGSFEGPLAVVVDALTASVDGFGLNNEDAGVLQLSGVTPVTFDQAATFLSVERFSGAAFGGQLATTDLISGQWALGNDVGSFIAGRIDGAADARYRFSAILRGAALGVLTFDVDGEGQISGAGYTLLGEGGRSEETGDLSGELVGDSLTASVSYEDGVIVDLTGTMDVIAGTVFGTWSDSLNATGDFIGSGCQLN